MRIVRVLGRYAVAALRGVYDGFGIGAFPERELRDYLEQHEVEGHQKNHYAPLDEGLRSRIYSAWRFAFDAFGYELPS